MERKLYYNFRKQIWNHAQVCTCIRVLPTSTKMPGMPQTTICLAISKSIQLLLIPQPTHGRLSAKTLPINVVI